MRCFARQRLLGALNTHVFSNPFKVLIMIRHSVVINLRDEPLAARGSVDQLVSSCMMFPIAQKSGSHPDVFEVRASKGAPP